jgi:transcriptional regulator with GAF, ATPase, and Fis domain
MTDKRPDHADGLDVDVDSAGLSELFVSLADTLVDDYDVVEVLEQLAQACVTMLHAAAAGLLLADQRGNLQFVASSSDESRFLELLQLQSNAGPCLECVRTAAPVTVADLAAEAARWPRFAQAALDVGYHAVDALPLRLRSEVIGGLNVFHSGPRPMTAEQRRVAQALADAATIGILHQRTMHRGSVRAEQLQAALTSRIVIEQAKGVIAQFGDLDMGEAFARLRRYARGHHYKLSELSLDVTRGLVPLGDVVAGGPSDS